MSLLLRTNGLCVPRNWLFFSKQQHQHPFTSAELDGVFFFFNPYPHSWSHEGKIIMMEKNSFKIIQGEQCVWADQRDVLPLLLWLVNYQENLELLGCRDLVLLHEPCRGSCLLHNVGDGAEEAPAGRLSRLGLPLRSWGSGRRRRPGCRRLGRGGGDRWRRLSLLGPLEVRHVAIGQVGDERAVREAPAQIIHGCSGESGGAAGRGGRFCAGFPAPSVQLVMAELSVQTPGDCVPSQLSGASSELPLTGADVTLPVSQSRRSVLSSATANDAQAASSSSSTPPPLLLPFSLHSH